MTRCRHFGALIKKNFIIWKRNLVGSLCEIICPILAVGIMFAMRFLFTATIEPGSYNIAQNKLFTPIMPLASMGSRLFFGKAAPNYPFFSICNGRAADPARTLFAMVPNNNYT